MSWHFPKQKTPTQMFFYLIFLCVKKFGEDPIMNEL